MRVRAAGAGTGAGCVRFGFADEEGGVGDGVEGERDEARVVEGQERPAVFLGMPGRVSSRSQAES